MGGAPGLGGGAIGAGPPGGDIGGGVTGGKPGDCVHAPHASVHLSTNRGLLHRVGLLLTFVWHFALSIMFPHGIVGGGGEEGGAPGGGGEGGGGDGGGGDGGANGGGGADGSAMQPHVTAHFLRPKSSLLHRCGFLETLFAHQPSYFLVSTQSTHGGGGANGGGGVSGGEVGGGVVGGGEVGGGEVGGIEGGGVVGGGVVGGGGDGGGGDGVGVAARATARTAAMRSMWQAMLPSQSVRCCTVPAEENS